MEGQIIFRVMSHQVSEVIEAITQTKDEAICVR